MTSAYAHGIPALLLALAGLLAAGNAVARAAKRSAATPRAIRRALWFACATFAWGIAGLLLARVETDNDLAHTRSRVTVEHRRGAAFTAARSSADVALALGAVQILVVAAALGLEAKRRSDMRTQRAETVPSTTRAEWRSAAVGTAVLGLACLGARALPIPGRSLSDHQWTALEAAELLSEEERTAGCERLDQAIGQNASATRVSEVAAVIPLAELADPCVDDRLEAVRDAASTGERHERAADLRASGLLAGASSARRADILITLTAIEQHPIAEADGGAMEPCPLGCGHPLSAPAFVQGALMHGSFEVGEIEVDGPLAKSEVRRALTNAGTRFTMCVSAAHRRGLTDGGVLRVAFQVSPTGAPDHVRDGGSTLRDPATLACVLGVIRSMHFTPLPGETRPTTVLAPLLVPAAPTTP